MSSPGSVTHWLGQLRGGDPAAAQGLWERYFRRLVGLARAKLGGLPRRAADEEDVAQSAFHSFFLGVERGRFPRLSDRDNLWPLLVVITARKAADLRQHDLRRKRGGGTVRGDSALAAPAGPGEGGGGWEQLPGPEPTPAFAAQVAEEVGRLLGRLGDPKLRRVAVLKMEGHGNEEIKAALGCSLATVERKLALIRKAWEGEVAGD